jgi:hypothetical protein
MSGFTPTSKPGGSTRAQAQPGDSPDALLPGKRTLTEQVSPATAYSPSASNGAAVVAPHVEVAPPVTGSPATAHSQKPSSGTAAAEPHPEIAQPATGVDRPGFVDNSKGAPIYNKPAEAGGEAIREPLPPACRVFVSGVHPRLRHWWYVTAYLEQTMVRGYVEDFRVNTNLPEPLAELRQLVGGETVEGLAKEKFHHAVTDGHDFHYYENVLLYVNRGRAGIGGSYQSPGMLGGGGNNIQLIAPHRIWLVSAEYAKTLENIVPSGSLTGGAVAKARRFAGHLQDILQSITESRNHYSEVVGEFAQAIRDHLGPIIGITAGFVMAEATSMFLATVPTGVSQAAAAIIQLALSAFGAAGMVEAGSDALKHGIAWLTLAWTAHAKTEAIAEASTEFLRMLVAIAVAALSYTGAKGNYRNALKIASKLPTDGLPAFAAVDSSSGGSSTASVTSIGASPGGVGAAGNAALRLTDREKAALGEGPDVDGLTDKDVGEARASERHDRRAADGRKSSAPETDGIPGEETPSTETRTELAKHIPPRGNAFAEWFDSLSLAELDRLLADKGVEGGPRGARDVIEECIRHPRNQHEWLMVGEVRQFKKWGVSMKTIQDGRTFTLATIGKRFRHSSGAMHRQLHAMIRSSNSYEEFLSKLNQWADAEMCPSHSARWPQDPPVGRYSLPDNLQVRSR